jgi:hypothetical protein
MSAEHDQLLEQLRAAHDRQHSAWTGSFAELNAQREGDWLQPNATPSSIAMLVDDVWCVSLIHVITVSGWREFARALRRAPAAAKGVLIIVHSRVQQLAGLELAWAELNEVAQTRTTAAHLNAAGGAALLLACRCDLVVADAAAPVGWLSIRRPFESPDEDVGWLSCDRLGVTTKDSPLVRGAVFAEQLEGRGILQLMDRCEAVDMVNRVVRGASDA